MKAPCVTFSPMFHWTDSKIRVHAAHCVLALRLTSLLHRKARAAGVPGGLDALVETLADLKLVHSRPTPHAGHGVSGSPGFSGGAAVREATSRGDAVFAQSHHRLSTDSTGNA